MRGVQSDHSKAQRLRSKRRGHGDEQGKQRTEREFHTLLIPAATARTSKRKLAGKNPAPEAARASDGFLPSFYSRLTTSPHGSPMVEA
jgi:hypothetical protein